MMNIERENKREIIEELDKLVDFTEQVSTRCEEYANQVSRIRYKTIMLINFMFVSMLTITLTYKYLASSNSIDSDTDMLVYFISGTFIATVSIFLAYYYNAKNQKKVKDKYLSEAMMLSKLIDVLNGSIESNSNMLTNFERVFYEMKVSRIRFGFKTNESI